jgi:hypothetical protein
MGADEGTGKGSVVVDVEVFSNQSESPVVAEAVLNGDGCATGVGCGLIMGRGPPLLGAPPLRGAAATEAVGLDRIVLDG